jgi:hypothetical protein
LFADILSDLAKTVASMPPDDADDQDALRTAAEALYRALEPKGRFCGIEPKSKDKSSKQRCASKEDPSAQARRGSPIAAYDGML